MQFRLKFDPIKKNIINENKLYEMCDTLLEKNCKVLLDFRVKL